jgi:hypothetical protein
MTDNRKFAREKGLVELLMRRRGLSVDQYIDPQQEANDETGADVIAVIEGRRIGIQVTELDNGEKPGRARAAEKLSWREAQSGQGTYAAWAQNDPSKLVSAIARAIASKVQHIVGCDEAWLLVSASVPEPGSLLSTFIITPWLALDALGTATSDHLAKCKYNYAFLHAIVSEEQALYCWAPGSSWEKLTVQDSNNEGRGFFDLRDRPSEFQEWITDTDGKKDGEVEKVLRELQALRGQGKPLPAFLEAQRADQLTDNHEAHAMKVNYKAYVITTFEREPGKYRATIIRLDGRMVTSRGQSSPQFDTGAYGPEDYVIKFAKAAIDSGEVK